MKAFRHIGLAVFFALQVLSAWAQDVVVTLTPVQQVLPPQALLYISNPGNYFNVSITNNSNTVQNVYLTLAVDHILPNDGLSIATPAKRQPSQPIVIQAGSTRILNMAEIKTLFNYIPSKEIMASPGLFSNYSNGSLGLLPEGQYQARMVAYKWNPQLANPVAVSNPSAGSCVFTICYKAQAPEFLLPMAAGGQSLLSVAKLDPANPLFTWKAPVINCNPGAVTFRYDVKIVELMAMQTPDVAMRQNFAVYQVTDLTVPLCMIPTNYFAPSRLQEGKTYVAQVTARTNGANANNLNYTSIENEGKSDLKIFQVVPVKVKQDEDEDKDKDKENAGKGEGEDDGDDYGAVGGMQDKRQELDSLYVFKKPRITLPTFQEGMARKMFIGDIMGFEWRKATFSSGEGNRQDTIKFTYDVQLFKGDHSKGIEEAVKGKPFFTKTVKENSLEIEWDDLKKYELAANDYIVVRILPKAGCKSIRYIESDDNVMDFAMAEHLAHQYFVCSDMGQAPDRTPTKKKASDFVGKTVGIGEYQMVIDEIKKVSKNKKEYFEGKGHVEWKPMGIKCMVAVKFDSLYINTADIVYGGKAVTYQEPEQKSLSDGEVVDKLFSDWGIDNLIGDTRIPYAKEIQQKSTDKVKNLAQTINISKYYNYVKKGQAVWDQFLKGEVKDLYMPVQLPKSINQTPVDIQIVSMAFMPTSATMNVLGEFTLPNSKYYNNDILLLGAPRLCISPSRVLPESGTLALLGDFTVNDPESSFDLTFKAPKNVLEPTDGCFISWHADKLELFDVDVDMTIPGLHKVDSKGDATNELPKLRFHASIGSWDDWFAEASMDMFEPDDLKGWAFAPGDKIVYDHSKKRNADGVALPKNYDRQKADITKDAEWQGLYIKRMGVIFPKMLSISDKKKSFEGRLRLDAETMFFDGSGATFTFGVNNVFDFNTAKVGGWGISMDEIKMEVMQNKFVKAYFNGKIQTPLEGKIGYRCDMYAQGKDEKGKADPNRSAYVFKTQQVDGLKFDFWLGDMKFNKDQTYFLVEHETFKNKDSETRVELCMGGDISITVGRAKLRSMGKVGAFVDSKIPGIHIAGMRIANCPRWKSNYTQNQYEAPAKGGMNDFFGWKTENNIATDKFYFSLGRWSLASEKKTLGCFDFNLKDFDFGYKNKQATLGITGQVSIMNGQLSADCGLDIVADVDLDKYSFKFNTVKFKKAAFDSSFGGVTLKGSLEASDGDDNGYKGEMEFALPGGFLGFKANGGYFKRESGDEKFTWGYFIATVQSSVGLRFDPIVVTKLEGGFYFNCTAPTTIGDTPTSSNAKDGVIGAFLGVGLATSGGDNLLSADMKLQVCYDTSRKKLSSIIMDGKLDAFKSSPSDNGLVSAECQLAYVNDTDKYIELNITASGGASLDNIMKEKLKALTGADVKLPNDVKQGLSKITEEEQKDDTKKTSGADKSKTESGMKASCGFEVSLNFKVTMTKGSKSKWHVYIGEPEYEKRCKLTLIDFQLGAKTDYFAAWAYLGATMYFCIGNELPNGGMLPDPPKAVMDFLNGTDVNGNKQAEGSKATSAKNKTLNQIKNLINSGTVSGGIMLGACAEGDFGVNAGIVYASGAFCFGFDLVLERFGEGAKCQGGKSMGYKGWYAMGQAYAMLKGDLGVRVKLWFIDKKVSLISVGLGAMLQAGLPNPTWVYGKVRARCSLLGGIFKFNHAIEFKAGDVCMPDYGNPLDNLEMFASASPGYKNDQTNGWKDANKVSVYSTPRFVTNYVMDQNIRLVDENAAQNQIQNKGASESEARANCERIYKFQLGTLTLLNYDTGQSKTFTVGTSNHTDFDAYVGTLEPDTRYKMTLTGYAKEWVPKYSRWENPEIDGKRQEKKDQAEFYFKTGPLNPTLENDIAITTPYSPSPQSDVRLEDAIYPIIALKRHRTDLSNSSKYDIKWEVWKKGQRLYTCNNVVQTGSSGGYECWTPQYNFSSFIKPNVRGGFREGSAFIDDLGYEIKLMRIDKSLANLSKYSTQSTKTNKSTKQNTDTHSKSVKSAIGVSQPSGVASSNVASRMNDFFADQEKEEQGSGKSTLDEKSNQMTSDAKKQDGRYELYTIAFDRALDYKFADMTNPWNSSVKNLDGEFTQMAVAGFTPSTSENWTVTDESSRFLGGLNATSSGGYTNLTTKFNNAYFAASFYASYLNLGGKIINKFDLYDYEQQNIPGFDFTFYEGRYRQGQSLDGLLSVSGFSFEFTTNFWRLLPFKRYNGSTLSWGNNNGSLSVNGPLWEPYNYTYGLNQVSNRVQPKYDSSFENTPFWRQRFGPLLAGDAIMVDMFSNELKNYARQFYKLWRQYVNEYANDSRYKDKYARYYVNARLKSSYNTYRTVVKTQAHGSYHWRYQISQSGVNARNYLLGTYKLPLRQIMLALWMSGDLGKIRGTKLSSDPVKNFNKNNYPHRYNHMYDAWNTMYYNSFDANTLLKYFNKISFRMYRPDAYWIPTGQYYSWWSKHRNANTVTYSFSELFGDWKITRTEKNGYTANSLSGN